jgi:hypothetical protein
MTTTREVGEEERNYVLFNGMSTQKGHIAPKVYIIISSIIIIVCLIYILKKKKKKKKKFFFFIFLINLFIEISLKEWWKY